MEHFIPVALDTYFRGAGDEVEFCQQIKAGGNHMAVATAGGKVLGHGDALRMREKELAKALEEFRALPEEERKPRIEVPANVAPPRRALPAPPANGLILKGHCAYLQADPAGTIARAKAWYYRDNPDRWPVETQSDMLWLTEAEWTSLLPADPKKGDRAEVALPIQRRFFSTIGIDYMEGSVNALVPRETALSLTVETVSPESLTLRLDGAAKLGKEFDETAKVGKNTRGSDVRVLGYVGVDRARRTITRFDVVGLGLAWGNKMEYLHREIRLDSEPWLYGIAVELVTTRRPIDVVPPYNMLHYGSGLKYFQN
ncbi:MAG TPA: hypothetical protein VNM14_13825 [Planctomycetota bacterium]|jgi:hypothetical protein|nr:hypothetical protein [Planctomycetota bacterium]